MLSFLHAAQGQRAKQDRTLKPLQSRRALSTTSSHPRGERCAALPCEVSVTTFYSAAFSYTHFGVRAAAHAAGSRLARVQASIRLRCIIQQAQGVALPSVCTCVAAAHGERHGKPPECGLPYCLDSFLKNIASFLAISIFFLT